MYDGGLYLASFKLQPSCSGSHDFLNERFIMSGAPASRPKVPEGTTRFLTTRQQEIKPGQFVGYDTIWEDFQKEVKYTTPKRP